MKKSQLRNRLIMKPLDTSHIEQFNELLKYAFQVTHTDLFHTGWSDASIKRSKYPILKNAKVLGWFDKSNSPKDKGEKLVSQIALYPMQMNIYNTIYSMGGITGVATYPEYSGIGLMADLMKEVLKIMKEYKQSLSCLYPYSIPYYRGRGWEIISDKMNFSIKDTQFPKPPSVNGMIQRVEENHPDLIALYNEFAMQTHGCLVRDKLAWSEYWRWDPEDISIALYYNELGKPSGYIVYLLENDIFNIKEMIYLDEEARYGIWGYIDAHRSMFDKIEGANYTNHSLSFLLEDGHIKESISPYIMARIVDCLQFLENYPFECPQSSYTLSLIVTDPLLEWNRGTFLLHFSKNGFQVEYKQVANLKDLKESIALDIQTLTTMLLGYKRPLYLRSIGRLNASDRTIDKLEAILPEGKAYFSDYF